MGILLLFISSLIFDLFYSTCVYPNCTNAFGSCTDVASTLLCQECEFRGKPNSNSVCECISPDMDPELSCLRPLETERNLTFTVSLNKVVCNCHQNFENGFWKLTNSTESNFYTTQLDSEPRHIYGDPSPPVCGECYSELYGPKPETVTTSQETQGVFACTKYGGVDPNDYFSPGLNEYEGDILKTTWYECGNHGDFNATTESCVCDANWMFRSESIKNINNENTHLCQQCKPLHGPPVPWEEEFTGTTYDPPYCLGPFTPDKYDNGTMKLCSGHGELIEGECSCFANFQLSSYAEDYLILEKTPNGAGYSSVLQSVTVETCFDCLSDLVTGASGPCTLNVTSGEAWV